MSEPDGVYRVPNDVYNAHSLPKTHFRGAHIGGTRDCWAYKKEGRILGFAVMQYKGTSRKLARVIVEHTLPKEECIRVGRILVYAMCTQYPAWKSVTDADASKEQMGYHEFYKVEGVRCVRETTKAAPKELKNIPLSIADWADRDKCEALLTCNPNTHARLAAIASEIGIGREIRPGGKRLSPSELQEKLQDISQAARALSNACPATQIHYEWRAK